MLKVVSYLLRKNLSQFNSKVIRRSFELVFCLQRRQEYFELVFFYEAGKALPNSIDI